MNQKDVHKEQLGYEVPEGYFETSKKVMDIEKDDFIKIIKLL